LVRALTYMRSMGPTGLRRIAQLAVLNANYIRARLRGTYHLPYDAPSLHEVVFSDKLQTPKDVHTLDIAKRLMDYGFHAPTMSFPIAGTLMIEPTESESKEELDRFCDAMIAIHGELEKIRSGHWNRTDNPLKNAPHTALELAGEWQHAYSREEAAFPMPWLRAAKFWPPVKRVDNVAGDRNFVCTCPPMETYA
ncbi:MAG TPA: glycine dehydrogenase (aminomethyl-transferring), partial [Burkholderiales bacterium]|nr:glycine dehydrogenase (aminomethyl-transferring) [Burkholderiales bacterium]